jgi:ribosomal 30S subunit maturation factor RimM
MFPCFFEILELKRRHKHKHEVVIASKDYQAIDQGCQFSGVFMTLEKSLRESKNDYQ